MLHIVHFWRLSGDRESPPSRENLQGKRDAAASLCQRIQAIKALTEDKLMRQALRNAPLMLLLLLFESGITPAQGAPQSRTLLINGQSGQAAVVQLDGRSYVDLEALAQITNGSLQFKANQIVLTLPLSAVNPHVAEPPASPVDDSGLSRDFMKAGIEEIALMREWASPLAYAIQNGYSVTEQWVAGYREQAANGLRLASVAASTEADHNALQLLKNEFEALRQWSEELVKARNSMDTAKYAMSASALRDEPLSQKIITCGHFLASMLGSSSFRDDPSCH